MYKYLYFTLSTSIGIPWDITAGEHFGTEGLRKKLVWFIANVSVVTIWGLDGVEVFNYKGGGEKKLLQHFHSRGYEGNGCS